MNKNHQKHLALSLLCALFATLPVLAPEGYEPVETKPVEIRKEPSKNNKKQETKQRDYVVQRQN
ncbi:MAG: hypothetical protein NTZ68_00485 [Candidatus Dependentiae bacterium]|nr:hypothetical protein [Candidatus Dependentiae bacterium]